jgi:hypothetical protein
MNQVHLDRPEKKQGTRRFLKDGQRDWSELSVDRLSLERRSRTNCEREDFTDRGTLVTNVRAVVSQALHSGVYNHWGKDYRI